MTSRRGTPIATGSADRALNDFIVSNYLFGDESRLPAPGDSLMQSGVIDSTGILELIEFLESRFNIEIAEEETLPANLDSFDNIRAFVLRKTCSGRSGSSTDRGDEFSADGSSGSR